MAFSRAWSIGQSYAENVGRISADLTRYASRSQRLRLQGYACEVSADAAELASVDGTARSFARFLASLASSLGESIDLDGVDQPGWQSTFAGDRYFLNVFSPCYPRNHSKHLETSDRFVVFFQQESSFDYCGINSTQHGTKEAIRQAFADAGMAYDGDLVDQRVEAELYVFPLHVGDAPVKWWHHLPLA